MMREGYVWVITNGIANSFSSIDASVMDSMQGVLGIKTYVPKTKELEKFTIQWKRKFHEDNPNITNVELGVVGLWAYDTAFALARAVEEIGFINIGFEKTNVSSNLTDLETITVSQNGLKLREALLGVRFTGLAGAFSLVNGQLQSKMFEVINVNGNGEREIALWTPEIGLVRKLNLVNTSTYSTSKNNLGPIIWPGDSSSVPKGWEIPTNGKKLRIGVPVKHGFSEFVKVMPDPNTNTTKVTGYCIDIFNAVMETLPYSVTYEFIPFAKPDGGSAGSYNDLVYQVFLGNFDVVVGDTTIIANRSNFVDFALPYTESGVSMVMPIKDSRPKNAWVFLKPLTWDLWMTSGCFFVFIGFVVWVLEHRINDDFRGPPSHQIGTSLWFVVIVWVFVVLILTQSYTASLTSLLTVQQLQPTVTDVNKLIKNREFVGYQEGSFVFGILKEMNFDTSKLRQYNSTNQCDELLSNGSANGGISAAFDEIPYMKLFLGQYCSKYTMVASIYKTDGFGFVFPRGSPLVGDVSRAILNVTEGEKMKKIENEWLGIETNCPDSNNQVSSNSLSLASFWGLFLIVGVASSLALIVSMGMFLYEEWQEILRRFSAQVSLGRRIRHTSKIFDERKFRSHTFRRRDLEDRSSINVVRGIDASEPSPTINCPPTPSSHLTGVLGDSRTPSREYADLNPEGQVPQPLGQESQPPPAIELIGHPNQEESGIQEVLHESS